MTVVNSILEKNHVKVWQCNPAQSSKLLGRAAEARRLGDTLS